MPQPEATTVFHVGTNHFGEWDLDSGTYVRSGAIVQAGDRDDLALMSCKDMEVPPSPFNADMGVAQGAAKRVWKDKEGRSCDDYAAHQYCDTSATSAALSARGEPISHDRQGYELHRT